MPGHISVVVADDSALMRKKIKEILESDRAINVVACARNGQDAVDLVREHEPDVVTMDINMPVMDGVSALQVIMMESPRPVIMLSSLTQEGAMTTFECLDLGAVDFVGKMSGTISTDIDVQAEEIVTKVKQAARSKPGGRLRKRSTGRVVKQQAPARGSAKPESGIATRVVAIGCSTGGPKTIMEVVPYLPADLDAAVVIVQHMPEAFTAPFASRINASSAITVKEAESGDIPKPGHGYLARGGKHMVFAKRALGSGAMVRYVSQPSDVPHIPSVDVMFKSVVDVFRSNVVGVLLTGMGADGADGMVKIRQAGGQTIAEDESTCVVFGMPAQAIERGGAGHVLPCYDIAEKIMELLACPV